MLLVCKTEKNNELLLSVEKKCKLFRQEETGKLNPCI